MDEHFARIRKREKQDLAQSFVVGTVVLLVLAIIILFFILPALS